MNEKIKELAEQSGFELVDSRNIYILDYDGVCTDELNKFAELIVRECITVVLGDELDMSSEMRVRFRIEADIKKHFGVER